MPEPFKKILSQLKTSLSKNEAPAVVKRRQLFLCGSIFAIVVFILWLMITSNDPGRVQQAAPDLNYSNFTTPPEDVDAMTLYLKEIQQALATADNTNQRLSAQIDKIVNEQQQADLKISDYETTLTTMQTQMNKYNEDLTQKMQQVQSVQTTEAMYTNDPAFEASLPHRTPSLAQAPLEGRSFNNTLPIQVINIDLNQQESKDSRVKTIENYIPPGTFVRAVMLNGLEADTSVSGQGAPKPVLMRIIDWGNLPNQFKSHLKDCHVVGAGIGDLSSERAYIRLDTLSCVLADGHAIDVNAFGHVVDSSDGMVGVKGTLRMRAGKVVSNAFFAGVLSGIGTGVSQQYMSTTQTALGQTSMLDPSRSLQYGFASGVGETGRTMSDYFIRRADQYSPVIQVAPQAVDIIFIKEGIWLNDSPSESMGPNPNEASKQSANLNAEIKQANNLFN